MKGFESAVPATFLSYAPTFFYLIKSTLSNKSLIALKLVCFRWWWWGGGVHFCILGVFCLLSVLLFSFCFDFAFFKGEKHKYMQHLFILVIDYV